jgi:hypothetical protein
MTYIKRDWSEGDGVGPGLSRPSHIYVPAAQPTQKETYASTLTTAWVVEGAVISIGLLVALLIGVQTDGVLTGFAAAAPFVAAASVEFARIPLTRMAFAVRGIFFKSLAIAMLGLLSMLTAEHLILGFEGAFTQRNQRVREAGQASSQADSRVADLEREAEELASRRTALERQIAGFAAEAEAARTRAEGDISAATDGTAQARKDIQVQRENVARQIGELQAIHRRSEASMNALCRASQERCSIGALQRRNAGELAPLASRVAELDAMLLGRAGTTDAERAQAIARRDQALHQVHTRQAAIEADLRNVLATSAVLSSRLSEARREAIAARATADAVRGESAMHRLAQVTLGSNDDNNAQKVLIIFATIASLTLASAGTVLATLSYRAQSQDQQTIRLRDPETAAQLIVVPWPTGIEPAAQRRLVEQAIATRRAESPGATFRVVPVEVPKDADEETRRKLIAEAVAAAA